MSPSEAIEAVKHMIVPTIQQMNHNHDRCSVNKVSAVLGLVGCSMNDGLRNYLAKMANAGILKRTGVNSGSNWIVVAPDIPLPAVTVRKPYRPRAAKTRTQYDGRDFNDIGSAISDEPYHAAEGNALESDIAVAYRNRKYEDDPRAAGSTF